MRSPENIHLHLDSIDQLFEPRLLNPFKNKQMQGAGMDVVYSKARMRLSRRPPLLILYLPVGSVSQAEVQAAIHAYCDAKMEQVKTEHQILKGERYFGLVTGFLFMTLCLVVSYLLIINTLYSDFVKFYIKEGLFIVGWVSMWRPTEILIFDWWPYRRVLKTYRFIKSMKVIIDEPK